MPYIIHRYNGDPISHFILEDQLIIGRHDSSDIQIDDSTLSAQHAIVERCPDGYQVRDLNSTNGVFYKGKKITCKPLHDGDCMIMGTHDLEYVEQLLDSLEKTTRIKKSWIPGIYFAKD